MRPKIIFGLLALALPFGSMAQSTLHVEFESAAPHTVFVADEDQPKNSPVDFDKTSGEVKIDTALVKPNIWVWNRTTGNMAIRKVADLGGKWVLKDTDYTAIGRLTIRVESKGQPVASAQVSLKGADKDLNWQSFLTPGDKGELHYYGVKPGTVALTVSYKVGGNAADPIAQSFNLALKRDKPDPVLIVSIPDAVDVVPAAGASPSPSASPAAGGTASTPVAAAPSQAPAAGGGTSIFGRIITLLLVLGLIGGGVYYIIVMMRKNSGLVQDKLRQLGVDVPQGVPQSPVDSIAPAPMAAPAPPQKIMLGDATPDPVAPVAMPSAPISVSTGVPTIRMANGDAFELPDGETIVGRDLGLGLSLVNESTVSRRHASLTKSGTEVRVKDLGSSNGTFVNGVKVVGEAKLTSGDSVQFGAVQCRYEG